jgi:probable HAF family extracellular repeat protein
MMTNTLSTYHRAILVAGALLLFELASANATAAPSYAWTEIVVPNAMVNGAAGPNDLGQVAVTNTDGTTGIYRLGRFTPLPPPPAGFNVSAGGINDAGVVVGLATTTSDTHAQAFILKNGQYRFFSQPGWQNSAARSIGPSGLVVGISYQDDQNTWAGWVYDPSSGTFTDATPPGSIYTIAQGINRFGRIAGSGQDDSLGRYAFIWQLGTSGAGTAQLVPFLARVTLGDSFANARGINDAGVIVGWTRSGGQTVGFVGSASEGYQLLVPPGGDAAGATSYCQGINNFRQVGCVVFDAAGNSRGFLGSPLGE